MTSYRVRVGRETAVSGAFEWAAVDGKGSVLEAGTSELRLPAVAGPCDVVIASDLVLLERLAAPRAQQRRIFGALRFLVEDSIIPDPERVHVAMESTPATDSLCVGIIDRQWLQLVLSKLARAGLAARSAWPECLLPELLPRTWTVVWNGSDGFARTAELEGLALDSTDHGEVPVSLRLALNRGVPDRILLRAASGVALPDAQRWSAALGVPVEVGPPWRWAEAPGRPRLDLLQGEFAPRRGEHGWMARLQRPALLAGALLVVISCGIAAEWAAKSRERRTLLAEMQGIYRETFGEGAVLVDPLLQMQRALAELRSRSGEASPGDFLPLLGKLSEHLLDPARQRIESITYERGALSISLRPHDPAQFAALREELRAKTPIRGLEVRIDTVESKAAPRLRLTAIIEGAKWALARP